MLRRFICLASLALVLGATGQAGADLVGHWRLDGSAADTSGNGLDGVISGSPKWVDGKVAGAMEVDGDDWIEIPGTSSADGYAGLEGEVTWAAWFKTSGSGVIYTLMAMGPAGAAHVQGNRSINIEAAGDIMIRAHSVGALTSRRSTAVVNDGQWHHVAVTIAFETDGANDTMRVYIDGDLAQGYETTDIDINQHAGAASDFIVALGARGTTPFVGLIDDVRIYDHVLSEVEILAAMAAQPWPYAFGPNPEDGALLEATWSNISWMAGELAVSHDVYVGENFDDVNAGAEGTFIGSQAATNLVVGFPGFPVPAGLVPGTTYYWRIDEVNDADPNSPWKGDVWSFTVPPKKAYDPVPPDGMKFVDSDATLSWTPGFGSKLHHVYFGDNLDDVNNATGALPQADATFTPGALEMEKTYYWRVDEFDGAITHKGEVWSLTTIPVIAPHEDPNLLGWWTLDEGMGDIALDWSGRGNHATLIGPGWLSPGLLGDAALDMKGGHGAIQNLTYAEADMTEATVCAWIRTDSPGDQYIASFDRDNYWRLQINGNGGGPGQVGWSVMTSSGQVDYGSSTRVDNGAWHHVCGVFDNGRLTIYVDGIAEPSTTGGSTYGTGNPRPGIIGGNSEAGGHNGGTPVQNLDDLRIYDRALTAEEIVLVMRGDPLMAWAPIPADGSTPDIDNAVPLSWSPGDGASSHEVYFGTDADAVKHADTSDATGVYRGSQSGTSFTPAEGVEWGGGPYYWRVDENNTDGTVTGGRVWSFTVADFILVDDFESYTDNDADNQAIWQAWIDGFGVPANGSQVGYVMPPYAEQTIVNGGGQSMPLFYDNTAGVGNSEAVLALTAPRDWAKHGVSTLSLWFRGYPASVGSFTEDPVGTFTMTGSGADVWGTSDEFHFAYKTLSGPGTIVARVDSVEVTHNWAKAGVMIRETLDADSKYAFAVVSAASGAAFQGRTDAATSAFGTTEAGIAAPILVKLERDVAGFFTVSHSTNGSSWTQVQGSTPTNIPMASDVYIGLAVTSHNAAATCEAKFSNVTITGNVGAQWMSQDVGILANAAEPFYVALSNANSTTGVVTNPDAAAAVTDVWTEWQINLSDFADQGVNLADVDKIAIGLGATGDPAAAGGSGTLFIDDITLVKPQQ
ncbi:MAG: LamG domain-containing protein [Planctomycetota bacterium]|jgi:hypothetical protein